MAENIAWAIIRDSIEIDDEFFAELLVDIHYRRNGEQIAPGSTLAMCARQVTVKSDLHVGPGSSLIENGTSLNGEPVKVDNVAVKLPGAYHLLIATERLDGEGKIITTGKQFLLCRP